MNEFQIKTTSVPRRSKKTYSTEQILTFTAFSCLGVFVLGACVILVLRDGLGRNSPSPHVDIAYSTLRQWSPNDAARGLGLEIVLGQDVTEQDLIDLVKQLSSGHDPVVIRVFTSETAYEQEKTNNFGPEYQSDYLLFYVKNGTGSGAYSGFNEIRWMQEVGKFADKYGTKTQL